MSEIGFPDVWPAMTPWAAPIDDEYPAAPVDSRVFVGPFVQLPNLAALTRPAPWGSYLDEHPLPLPPYSLTEYLRTEAVIA
jgi:hypothetical protein